MTYQPPGIVPHTALARVLCFFPPRLGKPAVDADRRVLKLRTFIDRNDGQVGWSLDSLCRELGLGISGAHAGRLFKREFGIGVREYAAGRRLIKAAHLLCTTTLCVKTISGDLGYRSPADFCRKFKREFHLTPKGYRKRRCIA